MTLTLSSKKHFFMIIMLTFFWGITKLVIQTKALSLCTLKGYINMIVQERNWATVEGLNCRYITMGESADFPGMMLKEELPLLVTTDIRSVIFVPEIYYNQCC